MIYQICYNDDKLVANSPEERDAYTTVLDNIGVKYNCEEQFLVAIVKFQNDRREYTYLTDKAYPDNTLAVVETTEWAYGAQCACLKIVTVQRCSIRTKTELEKVCPFERYKKIVGTVSLQ